ncbi:hypothetical protein CPB83DRAFT_835046 [Crepidotus variabilis]|uniref:Uncharacterized protein n=1 Tax=Crepidotus variabilis TaxID=179855 RepID=A0A9P6JR96_9AGAR|nr:hypothetical protein CPB83DRAFT_835046 [Crepidotus variabilis]
MNNTKITQLLDAKTIDELTKKSEQVLIWLDLSIKIMGGDLRSLEMDVESVDKNYNLESCIWRESNFDNVCLDFLQSQQILWITNPHLLPSQPISTKKPLLSAINGTSKSDNSLAPPEIETAEFEKLGKECSEIENMLTSRRKEVESLNKKVKDLRKKKKECLEVAAVSDKQQINAINKLFGKLFKSIKKMEH